MDFQRLVKNTRRNSIIYNEIPTRCFEGWVVIVCSIIAAILYRRNCGKYIGDVNLNFS